MHMIVGLSCRCRVWSVQCLAAGCKVCNCMTALYLVLRVALTSSVKNCRAGWPKPLYTA